MERRFDMSDFERSLKDHADQFRLMPSKRVWNGIYNNLHPGSKWPSISIGILFIIILISIGNLNNSRTRSESNLPNIDRNASNTVEPRKQVANDISTFSEKVPSQEKSGYLDNVKSKSSAPDSKNSFESNSNQQSKSETGSSGKSGVSNKISNQENTSKVLLISDLAKNNDYTNNDDATHNDDATQQTTQLKRENLNQDNISLAAGDNSVESLPIIQNNFLSEATDDMEKEFLMPPSFQLTLQPTAFAGLPDFTNSAGSKPTNNTDFNSAKSKVAATEIKKMKRTRNKNAEWTFYATPTIGSVSFSKKGDIPASSSSVSSVIILPNDPSFGLTRTAKIGFETGADVSYKISKSFRFVTGANLSYSGYNNMSNLIHPTFASLTFFDKNSGSYSKSYVTNYGNGQSTNRIPLTNYSFEMSVPVGVQYNIWGNEKIRIDAVSTIDPSIVLKKNAFIISSDGRYYINDPSLVRNVNLAGHFGSYISFSAKNIKWHIGPDIRYQLLSTYKSYYPAREHFIDYGIRIGISR